MDSQQVSVPSANIEQLVIRCEEAAGQDVELGAEIALVIHELLKEKRQREPYPSWPGIPMNYTASLDDALTLLPPGADWRKLTGPSMSAYNRSPYGQVAKRYDGNAATPALQMCAAALRLILDQVQAVEVRAASAIEARTAATAKTDAVHESPVAKPDAQGISHDQ
jgi:hypothetical protein